MFMIAFLINFILVAVIKCEEQSNSCRIKAPLSSSLKEEPATPHFNLAVPFACPNEMNGHIGVSGTHIRPTLQPPLAKQLQGNGHNGVDSSCETQIRNARPRVEARGRNHQLLPRYWPRFTDQDLHHISGEYPLTLFEFLIILASGRRSNLNYHKL